MRFRRPRSIDPAGYADLHVLPILSRVIFALAVRALHSNHQHAQHGYGRSHDGCRDLSRPPDGEFDGNVYVSMLAYCLSI